MGKEFQHNFIKKAISDILVCPQCKNNLSFEDESLLCKLCLKKYPILDGIPFFLSGAGRGQEREKAFRNNLKYDSFLINEKDMLDEVSRHHAISVMRQRAKVFISKFNVSEWVADIGTGFSWHWKGNNPKGSSILGVDFSITNLRVAKRFLTDKDNVLLICADAANLPVRANSISGIWSVQVFQHFPEAIFKKAKQEIHRVLKDKFIVEIINLNPSLLLRIISRLWKRKFSPCKDMGDMELNRLSAKELKKAWSDFEQMISVKFSYSELFFQPPYLKWQYPAITERVILRFPQIAKHIARQIHLELITKR